MPEANYHPASRTQQASQAPSGDSSSQLPSQNKPPSTPDADQPADKFEDLKTQLSWTPSLHDRRFQLRALLALLSIGLIYLCFHFGLTLNRKLAVATEQQRLEQLFQQCLDHNGTAGHIVFAGNVGYVDSAQGSPSRQAINPTGASFTFSAWSEISKLPDPTIFVGKLTAAGGPERLVLITVDLNPAQARTDAGNLGIHVSTYSTVLPLYHEPRGDTQLNIYLSEGGAFDVQEGLRKTDGGSVLFQFEVGKQRSSIHVSLQQDGTISIVDDGREITHDTEFYELDRTIRD